MTQASERKDQQHPLWKSDRQTVDALLTAAPDDYNLAELARLRIRYCGFPGARDIQADLEKVLKQWNLTEEALFEKTRQIHAIAKVYRGQGSQRDDWS
ncbi:MAG: DUF3288 family protein [Leptolyngbyaceae cyanobacterium RU_5_1]|nr:DUF3288 family protein [Leptolyngbyaceae cyanobacterium RU_5_1]